LKLSEPLLSIAIALHLLDTGLGIEILDLVFVAVSKELLKLFIGEFHRQRVSEEGLEPRGKRQAIFSTIENIGVTSFGNKT
jgi:hypothetical protein